MQERYYTDNDTEGVLTDEQAQIPQDPQDPQNLIDVVVFGGSGACGRQLVDILTNDTNIRNIRLIGRRQYDDFPTSEKINQFVFDLDEMDQHAEDIVGDIAYCCLGTTRADAGSDEAFIHVDYDLVVNFAEACRGNGIEHMHVISSMGANAKSWFLYPRTKGKMENAVRDLGFGRARIYRPGLLDRGDKRRFAEKVSGFFLSSISTHSVAAAMVERSKALFYGHHAEEVFDIYSNKDIKAAAERYGK